MTGCRPASPGRGILQCFSDGERAGVAGAKSGRSLPDCGGSRITGRRSWVLKGSLLFHHLPGDGCRDSRSSTASARSHHGTSSQTQVLDHSGHRRTSTDRLRKCTPDRMANVPDRVQELICAR